jgi:eukaryotic-like serine/threonine-protein kinase
VPGDVIDGRYVVDELLGRGGMAEVYRARDTDADRCVALKVLRGVEPHDARRFRSEVDVLGRLDHPGLVRLCGSGTHDGVPYLVLDLAEGPTLAHELADGPLSEERAVAVAQEVAEALAHAHRIGVVHRDVKPSNILCDEHGRARLADFGIARLAGAPSLTRTGQMIGSAPYLAPEQVEGAGVGPPADIYALGLVLIECLTGRPCYPGGQLDAAVARLHRPPAVPEGTPQWLGALLTAMTERNPDRRPTAAAVAEALRDGDVGPILAPTQAVAAPGPAADATAVFTTAPPLAPRHVRRSPLAAAALVAAALLAVAAWASGRDSGSPSAPPTTTTTTVTTAATTDATPEATTAPPPHQPPGQGGKHEGGDGGRGHRR